MNKRSSTDSKLAAAGPALALGTNMAAGMAIFTFLGYKLDQKLGSGRTWTLCGMFLGLAYCGYEVWKLVRMIQSREETDETDREDGHPD